VRALAALVFLGGLAYAPPAEHETSLKAQIPAARWLRANLASAEMFAGFPVNDADNLMTLAERPCLVTHECDWPFHRGYLDEIRRRLRLIFPAYYAFSREDILPLAQQTPVRYLVVTRSDVTRDLERGKPRLYWQPHGPEIRRRLEARRGQTCYWVGPEAPPPVYQDERYLVFDLQPFR